MCLLFPNLCIYLIIHLYQYGLMNIYILDNKLLLLIFIQIVLVLDFGSSFSWLIGHSPILVGFCFSFEHFLTFWNYQDALGSFICFLSQSSDLMFPSFLLLLRISQQSGTLLRPIFLLKDIQSMKTTSSCKQLHIQQIFLFETLDKLQIIFKMMAIMPPERKR